MIGGGKTAMDTCGWLLDVGVDPDRIRWVRSRDGWYFNRAFTQPLEQVGSYMQLQARWVAAAASTGSRSTTPRPVFEPGRITLQYVTLGFVPWGAATIGAVEAMKDDDDTKNALCPPVIFSGHVGDLLRFADAGMRGLAARATDPEIAAWTEACRLNPGRNAAAHVDDPRVVDAFTVLGANLGPALENLERLA